jgi:hypothetical protein
MKRFSPGNLFRRRVVVPFILFAIAVSILPAVATPTFAAGAHTSSVSHAMFNTRGRSPVCLQATGGMPQTFTS